MPMVKPVYFWVAVALLVAGLLTVMGYLPTWVAGVALMVGGLAMYRVYSLYVHVYWTFER